MNRTFITHIFRFRKTRRLQILLALICVLTLTANGYSAEKGETPEYYEQAVEAFFDQGQWDEGMELLKEGLNRYTDSSRLNELAGIYYFRLQDYDNARYFLVKAVADTPDNETAKRLLITVEEETGNYSSAICYVNELLEIMPYRPDLWKRKIGLFRKQGNNQEADRLLKRLFQIFPKDSVVRKDYLARLEENYLRERKSGDKAAAIKNLQELLVYDHSDETYFMDLANLLQQQGDPESGLAVLSEGLQTFPCSETLITKKASILSGLQRYPEALAFLDERSTLCPPTGSLQRLRNSIMEEYARTQRESDPYRLYSELYSREPDPEILDYLLNEALRSGRDEDAKKYLAEARRRQGDTPQLRYKEYELFKRSGSPKASFLLERLYELEPQNRDIAEELALLKYAQAETLVRDGSYSEAIERLNFVIEKSPDPEMRIAALQKSYSVRMLQKRPEAAQRILEQLRTSITPEEYAIRRAETEAAMGNQGIALETLYRYLQDNATSERITGAYEEIATPYLKQLLEQGDLHRACRESRRAVELCPASETLILYAISSHEQAGEFDAANEYIRLGLRKYPGNPLFNNKMAASLYAGGHYREAVEQLRPILDSLPGNRDVITSSSASRGALAQEQIKAKRYGEAMANIDSALVYDPTNRDLLLVKGIVYEKTERYDSAYLYQSQYRPEAAEIKPFKQHLTGLQYKGGKNDLTLNILFGSYLNGRTFAPITEIAYGYTWGKHRFFINPSYTAHEQYIDDDGLSVEGGQGIRLLAGWEGRIAPRWNASLAAGWANEFFPTVTVGASISRDLGRDWSLALNAGYRTLSRDLTEYQWVESTDEETGATTGSWVPEQYIQTDDHLFNVGLTATKSYENLILTLSGATYFLNGHPYCNGSAQLKYFPNNDQTSFIRASLGAGNAPELDVIDLSLPGCFNQINVSATIGAGYLVGKHLLLGFDLSYGTFYTQSAIRIGSYLDYRDDIHTKYKNILNANIYLSFHF